MISGAERDVDEARQHERDDGLPGHSDPMAHFAGPPYDRQPYAEPEQGVDRSQDAAGSWTDRVLRLRDELGPFRLAYLEMLLRIADETASARAEKEAAV